MKRKVSVVVMDPCYRAEILFVQLEMTQLHVADRSFRVAIAKTNILFVGIFMNLQSPVSKVVASNAVTLNVRDHAPRAMRWAFA